MLREVPQKAHSYPEGICSAVGVPRKAKKPDGCQAFCKGGRRPTFPHFTAVSSALPGLTSLFGMGRGAPRRHSRHLSLSGLGGGKKDNGKLRTEN